MKNLSYLSKFILLLCFTLNPLVSSADESPNQAKAVSVETGKININTANATLLAETLKGIGIKRAHAIIEYRKTYGPFHNIQELADVSGIGDATLEKNAHLIAIN